MWIFLLLAVVSSSGIVAGLFGGRMPKILASRGGTASRTPASNKPIPERETIYATPAWTFAIAANRSIARLNSQI